jgi:methylenetetrahydrofolate dehydrogenase (NADP+)/methenyltetrahydrofolate cyclohydrolase
MQILDGKKAAQAIKDALKIQVAQMAAGGKQVPHLVAVLVGNNGASETYVASKVKACEEVGFKSTLIRAEETISALHLLDTIRRLNADPDVDGILVQLPLPPHIAAEEVINTIDPSKDVDGFHPNNVGRLVLGHPTFVPATPHGIMLLLEHYKVETRGKHAVVVGRSNIVGRPMSVLLSASGNPGNCTVTICHSQTTNLAELCRTPIYWLPLWETRVCYRRYGEGRCVVVDVGITRVPDATKKSGYRIAGDVDFKSRSTQMFLYHTGARRRRTYDDCGLLKNTYKACALKHYDD